MSLPVASQIILSPAMLSLPHLEAMVAIAELGSFRAASERLNITQPSISLRIKELEQSLGVQLFDRSGYRSRLTPEGTEILKLAQRTLALAREIRAVARSKTAVQGKIRLGACDTFALACLPTLLTRLETLAPALQIALDIDYSVNLDKKLHDGNLDIAFLTSPTAAPDLLLEQMV
ncbi:MAG: LysR family transcriptional regulator, partial [Parvibaculaceae bacterium]